MSVPAAQLTCEQCQRRKTKCNKTVPCSACQKAGITCTAVQRHRLPRGRSGKQRPDVPALKDRIGRLEAIVSHIQRTASSDQVSLVPSQQSNHGHSPSTSVLTPVESFVAPDFWTELSEAVAGLKETLEEPSSTEELEVIEDDYETSSTSIAISADPHRMFFDASPSASYHQCNPSTKLKELLLTVYKDRVDAMFKPLHWPSALSIIKSYEMNAETSETFIDARALTFAVYFTATCALFHHELNGKDSLMRQFQRDAEEAFAQAGLLTTTKLVVLQAFVIYLAGLRACQANAQQWTLTATAIRIASAQNIPGCSTGTPASFDTEIKRRLWFCIGVLDLQSAFDRGSQPLLKSDEFQLLPLDINDSEISSQTMPTSRSVRSARFTEMSLSVIIHRAGYCHRRLTEIGSSQSSANGTADAIAAGYEQIAVLSDFENHVSLLSNICDASPSPLQSFTISVAKESLVAMRLLLHRPLYRRGNVIVPIDHRSFDVIGTATEVLECNQMKRYQPEFSQWAWFSWVKWYALAVVLAELCTAKGPQADHAWEVSQRSYDDYASTVADAKGGLLWKPISKLMLKAKAVREAKPILPQDAADDFTSNPHSLLYALDMDALEQPRPSSQPQSATFSTKLSEQKCNRDMQHDLAQLSVGELTRLDDMSWLQWDYLIEDFQNNDQWESLV